MTIITPIATREEIIDGQRVTVKVMPTGVAAYGGSPGLRLCNPGASPPSSFNHDQSLTPEKVAKGRASGQKTLIDRNRRNEDEVDRRRQYITSAYAADPTPACLNRVAAECNLVVTTAARYCREAGLRGVSAIMVCGGSNGHGSGAATSTKFNRIFDIIAAAAEAGDTCPTNIAISAATDYSDTTVSASIMRLEKMGRIKIERWSNLRVITIVATGASTKRHPQMK